MSVLAGLSQYTLTRLQHYVPRYGARKDAGHISGFGKGVLIGANWEKLVAVSGQAESIYRISVGARLRVRDLALVETAIVFDVRSPLSIVIYDYQCWCGHWPDSKSGFVQDVGPLVLLARRGQPIGIDPRGLWNSPSS